MVECPATIYLPSSWIANFHWMVTHPCTGPQPWLLNFIIAILQFFLSICEFGESGYKRVLFDLETLCTGLERA